MASQEHKKLKGYATQYLRDNGFKDNEIYEEYKLESSQMTQKLYIDIVGIRKDKKVAIECGRTSAKRLSQLSLFFDGFCQVLG